MGRKNVCLLTLRIFSFVHCLLQPSIQTFLTDNCHAKYSTCKENRKSKFNEWSEPHMTYSSLRNCPRPAAHVRAAVYVRYDNEDRPDQRDNLERVLLFGGWEHTNPYAFEKPSPRGSWIYTPIENSWFRLPSKGQPPDRLGHSLTTVCRNIIVMFGGVLNSQVNNRGIHYRFDIDTLTIPTGELWIFDGVSEEWQNESLKSSSSKPSPRAFHSAAAFDFGNARCEPSIFIFGGMTETPHSDSKCLSNELWQLNIEKPSKRGTSLKCTWIEHLQRLKPSWPTGRYLHSAVNVNNKTMYLFGGLLRVGSNEYLRETFVWNFDIASGVWNQRNYSRLSSLSNNIESPLTSTSAIIFYPKFNQTLQIESGRVFALIRKPLSWDKSTTSAGSSAPISLRSFDAVAFGERVLVFAGVESHTSFLTMRVWYIEMIHGTWTWQLRPNPRNSPPLQALASWNVIDNRLVFSASTAHEWAAFLLHKFSTLTKIFIENVRTSKAYNVSTKLTLGINSLKQHFDVMNIGLDSSSNSVWQLDLNSHIWWQYSTSSGNRPLFYTASSLMSFKHPRSNMSLLLTYGGSSISEYQKIKSSKNCSKSILTSAFTKANLFVYVLEQRRWLQVKTNSASSSGPEPRVFAAITDIRDGASMILFGGVFVNVTQLHKVLNEPVVYERSVFDLYKQATNDLKNDVWKLTLSIDKNLKTGEINLKADWYLLSNNSESKDEKVPQGRVGHIALLVSDKIFIWGGMRLMTSFFEREFFYFQCSQKLWIFDLQNREWSNVLPQSQSKELHVWSCLSETNLCRPSATTLGNRIITIAKSKSKFENHESCDNPSLLSWFLTNNKSLSQHNGSQRGWKVHEISMAFRPEYLLSWNNDILAVKQELGGDVQGNKSQLALTLKYQDSVYITEMQPGCKKGYYSHNWKMFPCTPCDRNRYAQEGATECSECPKGLTPNRSFASSIEECSCSPNYCIHGQCFVAKLNNNKLSAECKCNAGFTGERCQYPTYFILGATAVVILIVLVVVLVLLCLMLKYRKQKNIKEIELQEMRSVWSISCSELQLLERIDDGMPGSYGDVHKARYRDMTVAVKKLKLRTKEFEREFRRETELMKSMRHENIVLFIGAGQFRTDDCPFLVVEYMQNGALTKILRNTEVTITKQQQLSFCLDTAKGMEFLHSQRPPRIHRDLKSSNLLLSANWVVKVADFGCARLVKVEGTRQPVVKRKNVPDRSSDNIAEPLLCAEGDLSDNVGAALWRAPEIFACEPYGTAVDVYSFGIVMWEIAARVVPYCDKGFRWTNDVKNAVLSGMRPTCPNSITDDYKDLLEQCWSAHPSQRPTFSRLVQRLQRISDSQVDSNNLRTREDH